MFPKTSISAIIATMEKEAHLISRCRHGDAEAWDQVFDLHYAPVGRFIFQLAPDFTREDVEEICQETFLSVIRNIHSFGGRSRLQTWIFRIAANKSRDYRLRGRAAKRGGGQPDISLQAENPATQLPIDPPSPAPGPDAQLLSAERMGEIGQALKLMDGPCREIIELRYFGDLSYDDISAELDLNTKTVGSRLSKCLDRLEKMLTGLFDGKKSTSSAV